MELKDAAVALTGISVILLVLGYFTGGMVFYAALLLPVAALAVDLGRYTWLISDLKRNLKVTKTLSAGELMLGSTATVTYALDYGGKRRLPTLCSQAAGRYLAVGGSPAALDLAPGRTTVSFSLRPLRRGRHEVNGMRMAVETLLFRGIVVAGTESAVNAYITMGSERAVAGASRGRLQRMSLPGGEAVRSGAGSDFSYVRNFMPGDSTRNIDWARSSRSPALVVRDFEDARILPVFILIDVDPSMDTGAGKTELESAIELATLVAGRVLLDNERAGLATFSRSDVVRFQPAAGGKDQMAHLRAFLSSIATVRGEPSGRAGFPTLQEAGDAASAFGGALGPLMEESMRQFAANVREDGFIKAITRASLASGTPCSIIVITNLSMGVASLLNGIRIAAYYGHNVSVALTPHIWYDGRVAGPEQCYDRYRAAKETLSNLRGRNITVVELSACEKPEAALYRGRSRMKTGAIRQGR
ncbi:MAG: hypothetical protein A4E28_02343 [Methanocella sp. PtaU1.Bin125]|nr:MAG: hypothetical protein A4E28_02343 [Methanocella sp. PtaU1.Bin125]